MCAWVIHRIKNNSGKGDIRFYLYHHYRGKDGKVHSDYVRPATDENDFPKSTERATQQKRNNPTENKISYTTRATIKNAGYPVHTPSGAISEKWRKGHAKANREQAKKYPEETKEINKLVREIPERELLGKHTKDGKIIISERVPKNLREAVAYHEQVEHVYMEV